MLRLLVLLHASAIALGGRIQAARRNQRGSVTTEHVLWAVAVIAIVAIVVAAVKSYVTAQAANIK